MALFWKYVRRQWRIAAAFILFAVIFAVVFALYRLPAEAVLYPFLLCALLGGLFTAVDFGRVRARHRELERIAGLSASMIGGLPEAGGLESEDYQAVIRALQAEAASIEAVSAARYRDMIDYYTIWVHQIKTPISSMRLQLRNEDAPRERRLRAELFRVEQYVEMALAFLRLDSESSDYVFREYSLDEIIRGAVRKFSHEFIDRKISLHYEPVDLTLVTDEKWLAFVLEQLISNALKYTREGSVKIYLKEPETLCVEDTGIGIAPEDLPRIFEKGYTGYNGRSDKRASGIGLYLCRRVCGNLGIGISARSQIGSGTVVELRLEQHRI